MAIFHYKGALAHDDPLFVGPRMRWAEKGRYVSLADLAALSRPPIESYVIVFGGRQAGKTSLINRLRLVLDGRAHVAAVDLPFLDRPDLAQVLQSIGRQVAGEIQPSAAEQARGLRDGTDLRQFLCDLDSTLPVVVALEELGGLSPQVALSLSRNLRALHQSRDRAGCRPLYRYLFLLAGGIDLYRLAGYSLTSPLRNVSDRFYLMDFSREQSNELLGKGFAALGLDGKRSEKFQELVYRYVRGQPALTQQLGASVESALALGAEPDAALIEKEADRLVGENNAHVVAIVKGLQDEGLWDDALALLASPGYLAFNRTDPTVERLDLLGLVREEAGRCVIRNPIYVQTLQSLATPQSSLEALADGALPRRPRQRSGAGPGAGRQGLAWMHLSDLQFEAGRMDSKNVILDALLDDLSQCLERNALALDFVVATGDVAFSAKADEYKLAAAWFDKLLARTGLSKSSLFVVPGNHDVCRGEISQGALAIGRSLQSRKDADAILRSVDDRRLMMQRLGAYKAFVNRYFEGHIAFDDEHYYYVRRLQAGDCQVAVLGLNSAWTCAFDEDNVQGIVIGEHQVREALRQAKDADYVIALLHHGFDRLRDFDRESSAAMLADKCDFVLHGHVHSTGVSSLQSPDGQAMLIGAGASSKSREHHNSYNLVKLDLANRQGKVILRTYSDRQGGFWTEDVQLYKNASDGVYLFQLQMQRKD